MQRANVNQLFDPGLTFDKATGDLSLEGDRVVINKFAIRNGGGSLDLGGNFDIASEVIDAELTVTLPLVENIPWWQRWPVACPSLLALISRAGCSRIK